MARLLGIPLVLHEQNRIPGTTNRWLARRAQAVLEAFPGSFAPKVGARCTGNPVREEIVSLTREIGAGWVEPVKFLVLGGSQGALALNQIVPESLARVEMPIRVFHQTGESMRAKTAVRYAQLRMSARIEAFVEDMAEAYAWADLVVCRSGAMTVSELTAAGLPAILVPYPYAIDDHQTHNAPTSSTTARPS
jgi:UDP-N-acetylglucosamine--N-acetylmuramyl-(pentapeptide) pyrophosphoryl-undecaprenol N-acetylglucosamine transferase